MMVEIEEILESGLLRDPAIQFCGAALLLFLISMPPFIMILRLKRANRSLLHEERLQALEKIASLPDASSVQPFLNELEETGQSPNSGRLWIAFTMGCLVPVAAFAAVSMQNGTKEGVQIASWIAAIIVSVACVICATILAATSSRRANPSLKGKSPGVSSMF
ncbi:hypothetical protein [Thalassoroseus pseudoceratinae]|uniref:hypothetical protein n=1 Tax=Thalassoroseus pseudoceratinae TaxID=2713176 RepID=UPI001421E3E5|nr:hypothetical protein [Thalassoroseus pseudoceratinae]